MKNIRTLQAYAKQQPGWFYLIIMLCLVMLVADFFKRIHVPVTAQNVELHTTPLITFPEMLPQGYLSEVMQQWLDTAVASTDAANNAVDEQAAPVLMTGATDLAGLLVRVRAIFIQKNKQSQRIALIELQQTDNRLVSLQPIRQGEQIGSFIVADIQPNAVLFRLESATLSSAPSTISVPVFQPVTQN